MIDRLTSAVFHRTVSVPILRLELSRWKTSAELSVLLKHVLSIDSGFELLGDLVRLRKTGVEAPALDHAIHAMTCEKFSKFTKLLDNPDFIPTVDYVLRNEFLSNEEFVLCVECLVKSGRPLVGLVDVLERQILKRNLIFPISIFVKIISKTKMTNTRIFRIVVDTVLGNSSDVSLPPISDTSPISPATALLLIRELGFAGYTDSRLLDAFGPIFSGFKNYQAISSVYMIGGGLTRAVVDSCMNTIRADMRAGTHTQAHAEGLHTIRQDIRANAHQTEDQQGKSSHSISVQGHCQFIRRLVVCGFIQEAMELYSHFPPEEFSAVSSNSEKSQIYRLFLASFVYPEIVPMDRVACLKNLGSRTYDDPTTSSSSFLHQLVVDSLNRLNIRHVSEYIHPETLVEIDIFVPSLNLAIEVQGPSHYLTDLHTGERKLRIEDEFKSRVLKAVGINVELLGVYGFGRNNATRNADTKVSELIHKYTHNTHERSECAYKER